MELIKKIKQAETQAQDIIDKARADVLKLADDGRRKRADATAAAETERKRALEAAVADAAAKGKTRVEQLKADSQDQRRALRDEVQPKMPAAVDKVVAYLKD